MMPYTGEARQQWTLEGNRIVNRTHECLDIVGGAKKDGAELCAYRYQGSSNQHWRLEYVVNQKEIECRRSKLIGLNCLLITLLSHSI